MKAVLIAAALLAASPAMAGDFKLSPKANDSQKIEYDHGKGTTFSHATGSDVELTYIQMFTDKRPMFLVTVTKLAEGNIDMDVSNVSATYSMQPLHVYTADELKKIVVGHARWEGFAVAAMGGVAAGLSSRATSTSTSYGRVGNTSYSSQTTTSYTDPYARDAALGNTNSELASLRSGRDQTLAHIDESALQRTTMKDDDPYSWKFVIDKPKTLDGSPLKISVTVGQDTHTFDFDASQN